VSSTDADREPSVEPGDELEPVGSAAEAPAGRSLRSIATDLLRPKTVARAPGMPPSKAVVNGLERRELVISVVTIAFDLYLVLAYWSLLHHSSAKIDRADAPDFLIAGLIAIGLVLGGVAFRRRALLGFATFLVGLDFLTYRLIVGFVLNAGIGAWLLFRVSQRQKARAGTRATAGGRSTRGSGSGGSARGGGTRAASKRAPGRPAPSKRYTPPRRKPGSPKS